MGWSGGGGGSVSVDNETIKENVHGQIYVVPDTAEAVQTSSAGVGTNIDNETIKINSSNQLYVAQVPNVNAVAVASNIEISTTGTTVLSYTPTAQGNFMFLGYVTVDVVNTDLTLTASWSDSSGAQSYSWLSNTAAGVLNYILSPLMINATTASPITFSATGQYAEQVYASVLLLQI